MTQKEALYGGAAGGGKSIAGLMGALEHVDTPGYSALLLRKTYADLAKPKCLIPLSHEWLGGTAAKWNAQQKQWKFPSGATISFGYLANANDHYQYQGSAYQYIFFDELTQFPLHQYEYLFSRLRRTTDLDVPLRMRSGSNPGGVGHQWVFDRFVRDGSTPDRVFMPATIEDNPFLDLATYEQSLAELGPVEQARLRHGNWHVRRAGLVYPDLESCTVPDFDLPAGESVGGIDFGWNHPFCALAGVLDHDGVLWVSFERYLNQTTVSEHARHLPKYVDRWYADPSGRSEIEELRVAGHQVFSCVHHGTNSIQTGIDRVSQRIRKGTLKIAASCVNLRREGGLYHYDDRKMSENPVDADNHSMDSLSYLITGVDRWMAVDQDPDQGETGPSRDGFDRQQAQEAWNSPDNPAFWR